MTTVNGSRVPQAGIQKQQQHKHDAKQPSIFSPKNVALGGLAATGVIGGGVIGALRGSPLKGLAIGGAVASVALGAALLGNASHSQRDGYCDHYGDADCDYPGTYAPGYDYYPSDPYPHDPGGYPDPYYPGGGTSYGDDY